MRTLTLSLLLALLPSVPASANAQDTLSVAARLVMRQPTGTVLRLNVAGEQLTGVLERVADGRLFLASPPRVVQLSAVTDAWLQRRSTRGGAKAGMLVGAPAGAALFGLGALVLSGLCEYDCDDFGAGEIAVATLIGGAAGAATGYVVGALFGSSVARWEPLTESSAPPTIVARDPSRFTGLSAISVTPVVARAASESGGFGAGAGISYMSQLSNHVALGAEAALYDVKGTSILVPCQPPGSTCSIPPNDRRSWSAGGLARIGIGAERRLEPYALVGLGVTDFAHADVTLGSYSAGAGVRFRPGTGRFGVSAETRWHSNFTNSGDDRELGFYTLGIALTLLR